MAGEKDTAEQQEELEPHGAEAKPETDWKAEARKWEARAKENKGAADELQKLKESQMTEAERLKAEAERAKAEADSAKAEAERLKAQSARDKAVKEAARANGVDADLLALMSGDTPEEVEANAATLKAKLDAMPIYPSVADRGAAPAPTASKEQIEKINDPVERVRQRAAHPELYK